jgi:short-subunit dehydrogenase
MVGKRVIIPGLVNRLVIQLIRVMPRSLLLSLIDKRQARRRSARQA